ncbi:ARM repeat-containing protein [Melanogaster broomeanus]|nr:ARM repeat-containing protein [Melanogaster broomeanus]
MTSNPESTTADSQLDTLLKKSGNPSSLLPDELSYLATAFAPSQLRSALQSISHIICILPGRTLALSRVFQPLITSNLSETHGDALLAGATFHCALFQVDWQSASQIFQDDGFVELLATLEISTSPVVSVALARLYAQAASHKACRSLFSDETLTWLRGKSSQTADDVLRTVAVVALVKLSHASASDATAVAGGGASSSGGVERQDFTYAARLKELIMSDKDVYTFLNEAVEGLAYLSVTPSVKKELANATFLKRLFSFAPKRKATADATNSSTLIYGILIIVSNLCAYKPRLNQEQQQIAKLRRMAESGNGKQVDKKGAEEYSDPLESDDQVQYRCRIAISSGALDVLATAAGVESQGMRTVVGQILLSFAENKGNRGEVLKGGGAKVLTRIILPFANTPAIQALAKLAITASPIQVFGPNDGNTLDAIRPLSQMLLHPSANMLQQFEAMMALTNVASHHTTCAARIANTPNLLNKVELLMLEDHTLIRRASTELICNLVSLSADVSERYGGVRKRSGQKIRGESSKSKIQVLLAISDVEDRPTRLAASGTLAVLTMSPTACHAIFELQTERHRAFLVLAQLIDPAVYSNDGDAEEKEIPPATRDSCFENLLPRHALMEEVKSAGLPEVFEKLLKGQLGSFTETILIPAADVWKKLMEWSGN